MLPNKETLRDAFLGSTQGFFWVLWGFMISEVLGFRGEERFRL